MAEACKTGQIGGYGGDVWYPQPAPKDHPWRTMPYNAIRKQVLEQVAVAQNPKKKQNIVWKWPAKGMIG